MIEQRHIVSVAEARKILGLVARDYTDEQVEELIIKLDTLASAFVQSSKNNAMMHIFESKGSSK